MHTLKSRTIENIQSYMIYRAQYATGKQNYYTGRKREHTVSKSIDLIFTFRSSHTGRFTENRQHFITFHSEKTASTKASIALHIPGTQRYSRLPTTNAITLTILNGAQCVLICKKSAFYKNAAQEKSEVPANSSRCSEVVPIPEMLKFILSRRHVSIVKGFLETLP